MKKIKLTQGKYALVDDSDFDWLNQWKWYANYGKSTDSFYTTRMSPYNNGSRTAISMSRQILGLQYGDPREVDHQNHNTLDNQRHNLRICTRQQNTINRKARSGSTSIFKGVGWDNQKKRWRSRIGLNGKNICLGRFKNEKDAARAYDEAAKKYFREFANLNFQEVLI